MNTVSQDADPARTCIKKLAWPKECADSSEAGPSASKNLTVEAPAAQRHPGEAAAATPQHHEARTGTAKAAGSFPLTSLPSDLLLQVLLPVGSAELLRLSQVSAGFARACEECLKMHCQQQGWRFPRIPRESTAGHKRFPWRALYRRHACRNCGEVGVFPCRHGLGVMRGNSCLYLICKRCSQQGSVQQRLAQDGVHVDLFGINGQKLLPSKRKAAARQRRRS